MLGDCDMQYRLDFFDTNEQFAGYVLFEARDDETALHEAERIAKASDDRRAELWNGSRVVKIFPFRKTEGLPRCSS